MRLIDADALIKRIREEVITNTDGANLYLVGLETADLFTLEAPTIEAEPVRRGRWIFGFDPETGERDLKAWTCSECNEKYPWQPNYCPNCGARMEVEE